ncbi:hypothetical protein [Umezawaea tangerina]|uniref:Lipoprotein n=1 Tax=Umezawaea tangerina TaxID=84725 RepID=A0A2T0TLW3_9PSEU|nr:hypothetical protein [Umezawaea tangerina]PRY46700.1 hypothetical protein CLV43_101980 [Umezawaea tangerina]
MGIARGTGLVGVGAALLLLSACAGIGKHSAPSVEPSARGVLDAPTGTAVPSNQPKPLADVPVSIVTAMTADGEVRWLTARFVTARTNNRTVEAVDQVEHISRLAPDAVLLSPEGCTPGKGSAELVLDDNGLGTVLCSVAEYAALTPTWTEYAPAISFNAAGEITKMANHYHP